MLTIQRLSAVTRNTFDSKDDHHCRWLKVMAPAEMSTVVAAAQGAVASVRADVIGSVHTGICATEYDQIS